MALGIDDALSAAAAGINLTETLVETVKAYRKKGGQIDIELLIEEVRVTALQRLDEADLALAQFERTLKEKGVDLDQSLQAVINSTPWWRPYEGHRLKRIRCSFNALADATYGACDDIAALVKCRDQTKEMGNAIADSAKVKHDLHSRVINAKSVRVAIDLLRSELVRQKAALK
jgi:hypothetical protein